MKTNIILLFFLLISFSVFSQEREAKIYFSDSTSVEGFGEIKKEKIYFRVDLKSEITEWDFDSAKGLVFTSYGFSEKYEYIKPDKYSKPILMEVIEEGNVDLYKNSTYGLNPGIGVSIGNSSIGASPIGSYDSSTAFYVKRKNEENATDLSFSFKNRALKYFADCHALIDKIKKREFKLETISDIVFYYNEYCGP